MISGKRMNLPVVLVACAALASCAGYQLGSSKPPSLAGIRTVAVPMFKNRTLHPRAEALATSAVTGAFVQDGTYRLTAGGRADAILDGEVYSIGYSTLRSSRRDSLLAEELTNNVELRWTLKDAKDTGKVLASGTSRGNSTFFADSNLQTARQNALPDALERAGNNLVARLSDGF